MVILQKKFHRLSLHTGCLIKFIIIDEKSVAFCQKYVNGTTHVLAKNKLPDLISGSLVYCFRIPAGRFSDHGSSFSK